MPSCSFCSANLAAADVAAGKCPVCNKAIKVHDTVELDGPVDVSDEASSGSGDDLVTIESDTVELKPAQAAQQDGDKPFDPSDTIDLQTGDFAPEGNAPSDQTLEVAESAAGSGADDSEEALQTLPMEGPESSAEAEDPTDKDTFLIPAEGIGPEAVAAEFDDGDGTSTLPIDAATAESAGSDDGETLELSSPADGPAESFPSADEQASLGTLEIEQGSDGEPGADDNQATMEIASAAEDDGKSAAADASAGGAQDDSLSTLPLTAGDADADDSLSTMPLGAGDDDKESGLDSGVETMATMIVEIPRGEREGLLDEQFDSAPAASQSVDQALADVSPIDSIDESEQLATMPMDLGTGGEENLEGQDSIDVAESAATYVMGPDDAAIEDQVAQAFGDREGRSDQSTQQTIISQVVEPSDDDRDSYEQTLITNDLPEEVLKTMKAAWVTADRPDAKPGMTVKAEDLEEFKKAAATAAPETSLVINLRRLVEADTKGTTEAEYELIKVLGEGGMGVVYLARQTSIDRSVAIKMLKPKTAQDADQRKKFLAEAVVTGDLDHPNIVPIYDVGSNDSGALFYSMKKVEGTPWLDVIKEKTLEENLDILDNVANAVSFAHARGVVHRDLKPENVMLGGYGEVLVMDWGLAQPTKEFSKTGSIAETRSMGGTPAYMAPEMATGPLHKIGPHSDIYLLGAMLFEIVTGKPPHRGANAMKCLMSAARNEIRPVEETGELMDIAMRAMATDIEKRHKTVKEFQEAIKEYVSHSESIDLSDRADKELKEAEKSDVYQDYARSLFGFQEAYALWNGNERAREGISESRLAYAQSAQRKGDFDLGASLLEEDNPEHAPLHADLLKGKAEVESRARKLKFAKRAGIALVLFILVGGAAAGVLINEQKNAALVAQSEALKAKDEADRERAAADEQRAVAVEQRAAATTAAQEARVAEEDALKQKNAAELAQKKAADAADDATKQKNVAVAAQEKADAAAIEATTQKNAAVVSAEVAREQTAIAQYRGYISTIGLAKAKIDENAFDAARDLLLQYVPQAGEPDLRNWEWGRLMYLCSQEQREFQASGNVLDIDVSLDGTRLLTASAGGTVEIWDLAGAHKLENRPLRQITVAADGADVDSAAFSPDGRFIAVGIGAAHDNVLLWNVETGELVRTFGDPAATAANRFAAEHTAPVLSVQFSQQGDLLATGSEDQTARVWNVETGRQLAVLRGHNWWVWDAAFSPDGKQLVTAGQDGIAFVWTDQTDDKNTRWTLPAKIQQGSPFTGHTGPVYTAAFSPDGKEIVTGGYDRNVLIWKPQEVQPYRWQNLQVLAATQGRLEEDQRIAPPARFRRLEGHIASVRAVRFFRKESSDDPSAGSTAAGGMSAAADNLLVLSSGDDGTVKVWNAATGAAIKTFRGHGSWVRTCAFSPDGQSVLSGSGDGTARQWSIADYAEIRELTGREFAGHGNAVLSAAFSFDNRNIVTASQDRTAKTWSDDGRELRTFREGHEFLASSALFFPDGQRMLTAAVDNTVRIWSVPRGTELQRIEHTGRSAAVALSRDGRWILTGSDRGADDSPWVAKLWNADSGELVLELKDDDPDHLTHTAEVTAVAFSDDGRLLFTGDGKGNGYLWQFRPGAGNNQPQAVRLHSLVGHTWGQRIVAAQFLHDGSRVLTASTDNTVAQWNVETGVELKALRLKHEDALTAMDVAHDGQRTLVLTGCADLSVRLWNADTAREIGQLSGEGGMAALSRNVTDALKRLNLRPQDVWEQSDLTKEQVTQILNPTSLRRPADFADVVQKLAGALKMQRADLLKPFVTSVALSADGRRALTTQSEDRTVRLWDLSADKQKEIVLSAGRYQGQPFLNERRVASVEAALFSPPDLMGNANQFILTVGGADAQLWDANSGRAQILYSPHGSVAAAGYSPDGKFIVTAGLDSSARIWNADTGTTVAILTGHRLDVNSAEFSPDGQTVLTASRDKTARLWDAATGRQLLAFEGHTGPVGQAVFSHDGRRVATASDDGTARIWNVDDGAELARLDCRSGEVLCVAFSQDGNRVITGTRAQDDETGAYAKIWELQEQPNAPLDAREILYLTGHKAAVTSVSFSPDAEGSRALTGSEDYIVKLWDMRTADDIARLAEGAPAGGAAAPGGGIGPVAAPVPGVAAVIRPALATDDAAAGAVALEQPAGPEAAKEILSLAGHRREVTSVAFSHDGHEVLTGSRDGKAILWLTIDWTGGDATPRQVAGNR